MTDNRSSWLYSDDELISRGQIIEALKEIRLTREDQEMEAENLRNELAYVLAKGGEPPHYLTVSEMAKVVGISRETAHKLLRQRTARG